MQVSVEASGERSSRRERDHARKRARNQGPVHRTHDQQSITNPQLLREADIPLPLPPTVQAVDPMAMSFEARIGLALKGSDWQELQSSSTTALVAEDEIVGDAIDLKVAEGENEVPKELTAKQKKKMDRFGQTIARDAGDVLHVIEATDLIPIPENVTWDKDPELLCSYNWQASTDGTNTIFVPGEPAKWHPPTLPHTIERDSGYQYADYNYARQPRDPYSPMFHALGAMNPNYQFNDVDVLADRNNLRVLLEFVQGKANGPFRLDLYLVFDTLIIVRKESRWWKFSDGASYGCNFEKFFTRPAEGMEDATSHYRAIKYPMGPLNVVCRFEADAYDDGVLVDDLTQSEAIAVSGGLAERPKFDLRAPIRVLQKGHIVPTSQMVELKTQKYDPERFRPVACQDQLWFGRTSLLFTGPYEHNTGVIKRVKREDATERIKNWEENNQENLRKLVTLLTQLRGVLKRERRPNRAVVLVRDDKAGPISVRSMEGMNHAVGKEFFMRHWKPIPTQYARQRGDYHGHRGGRGPFNSPRGHDQQYGNQSNSSQPYGGPSSAPRGRGHTARNGGSNRGRGGSQT
ncbi:Nn.00g082640.m01.CDS01 [Neocucurbitaria sp. VM-36]